MVYYNHQLLQSSALANVITLELNFAVMSYLNSFSLLLSSGLPAIIVAVSLGIAIGNDGIETFVNDEK